jgi:FG-GAP repeat
VSLTAGSKDSVDRKEFLAAARVMEVETGKRGWLALQTAREVRADQLAGNAMDGTRGALVPYGRKTLLRTTIERSASLLVSVVLLVALATIVPAAEAVAGTVSPLPSIRADSRRLPKPTGGSGVARGDFDGDGFGDLAVGIPLQDVGSAVDAGAVEIIYGSADGLRQRGNQFWTESGLPSGGSRSGDHFGSALAAGDFDGDGFSDLAIGIPGKNVTNRSDAGAIRVIFGGSAGLARVRSFSLTALNTTGLTSQDTNAHLGAALAWGDFNGDAIGDLAAGQPGFASNRFFRRASPSPQLGAGRVLVFFGRFGTSFGLTPQTIQQGDGRSGSATLSSDLAERGDGFGSALAAGNFNGDAFADLAIGVPFEDTEASTGCCNNDGLVHVLSGSAVGLAIGSHRTLSRRSLFGFSPLQINSHFGAVLAAGDFDGNSSDDLAVGVPDASLTGNIVHSGEVDVLYGVTGQGLTTTGLQVWNQTVSTLTTQDVAESGDHFGAALAAGDFNGDGFKDLAIGVPDESLAGSGGPVVAACGVVHVIYGATTRLSAAVRNQFLHQPLAGVVGIGFGTGTAEANDRFGAALSAWNFGKSAVADLAIGVPGEDLFDTANIGMVQVVYGLAPNGVNATGSQFWHMGNLGRTIQEDAGFGSALY